MKKTMSDFVVLSNIQHNRDSFLLEFKVDVPLAEIKPGQFVNLLVKNSPSTFLRRPFSISEVNYKQNTLSILVKVVGAGSEKLSLLKTNDTINAIFPLGNGFSCPKSTESILLVGGGIGIAPMLIMAKEAKALGTELHILLGARTKDDHILIDVFRNYGETYITTNDGSLGVHGVVTDHPIFEKNKKIDRIYCCGPESMMKAVARIALQQSIECEVSLENMMACGFGVCLCCITSTIEGNRCVCTDGPVFNIKDLKWQI